jgi:Protein of unknown function (DUF3108)
VGPPGAKNVLLEMIRIRKPILFILTALLLITICAISFGQAPSSITKARPFEPSEELTYKAEFSRSLLRKVDVANFKFAVNRVATASPNGGDGAAPAYMLKLTGDVQSQGFFAKLFGVSFRQRVESTVEAESFAVQKTTRLDEQGKRARASEAIFDHDRGQVTWVERDLRDPSRPQRTVTTKFEEPIQDILSAIYSLRLRELETGKKFDVAISDSGKVYQVSIAVRERKRMKTSLGSISVIRLEPQLFGPHGMIADEGSFSIWLTDDERRIPVSARVKTSYGTFDITLKKASTQRNTEIVSAPRE